MNQPKPQGAVTIFVLGLLGLLLCQILGVFAWIQGNEYMRQCQRVNVEPEGLAVAGRILGILATILLVASVLITIVVVVVGAIASTNS